MKKLTKDEIRAEVDQNNYFLKRVFTRDIFVLNGHSVRLVEEKKKLQEACGETQHEYNEDGVCIWCDYSKEG